MGNEKWLLMGAGGMTIVFILIAVLSPDTLTTTEDEKLLAVCLAGHNELVQHNHVEVHIIIDGVTQSIPPEMGINDNSCNPGMRAIHTHDDSGRLHIETPYEAAPNLGNFFSIWGQPFDSTHLMDAVVDDSHQIVMRVSESDAAYQAGQYVVSDEFETHKFTNGEVIVLEYKSNS
jgi:hypothetical protein